VQVIYPVAFFPKMSYGPLRFPLACIEQMSPSPFFSHAWATLPSWNQAEETCPIRGPNHRVILAQCARTKWV